jgi:hypothetical protein
MQDVKEDAEHAVKSTAISAETAADVTKEKAKGFGARLWGKGEVSLDYQITDGDARG